MEAYDQLTLGFEFKRKFDLRLIVYKRFLSVFVAYRGKCMNLHRRQETQRGIIPERVFFSRSLDKISESVAPAKRFLRSFTLGYARTYRTVVRNKASAIRGRTAPRRSDPSTNTSAPPPSREFYHGNANARTTTA